MESKKYFYIDICSEAQTADSVLELLNELCVLEVEYICGGGFRLTERCNNHFSAVLSKYEMLALAQELIQLVIENDN